MRLVLWTDDQIKALREYAEAHPMQAAKVIAGASPPAGDIPGHVLRLIGGMKVVLSIETDQPWGVCRHLSVSVDTPGKWPNPDGVLLLAKELGFRPSFEDGEVWQDQTTESINWVQTKELT